MKSPQRLLGVRKALKRKKPAFLKQDAHKIKRLKKNWRQPYGMHSKMRKKLRGYRRHPSVGFSSPLAVRHLSQEGYPLLLVSRVSQLAPNSTPITIASSVGLKKKLEIVKKAKEMSISITNVRDAEKFMDDVEKKMKDRKEAKKKKVTKKEKQKEELAKKAEKKEEKQKEEDPEEKTKREQEEKRKVLEQGQ